MSDKERTIYVGRESCGCVSLVVAKNSNGSGAKEIGKLLGRGGSLDFITDDEYQSSYKSWQWYHHHHKRSGRKMGPHINASASTSTERGE